ncbi:hypothetical protein, partial [Rhizobium leguminosarum]|uniref:hypothetical protein n=1 Tax=Rhizobium leguminosarum TaxID=384 RepID=UPI001954657A
MRQQHAQTAYRWPGDERNDGVARPLPAPLGKSGSSCCRRQRKSFPGETCPAARMTRAASEKVSEQFDLFLPYLADLPLRD